VPPAFPVQPQPIVQKEPAEESDPIKPKHRDASNEESARLVDLAKLAQQGCAEDRDELFGRLLEFLKQKHPVENRFPDLKEDAEDILIEALLKAREKFNRLKDSDKLLPWVNAFVVNTALNWRRKLKKFGTPTEPTDIIKMAEKNKDAWRNESVASDLAKLSSVLNEELMRLDEPERTIGRFELTYFNESEEWPSLEKITMTTGIPETTAGRYRKHIRVVWQRVCRKLGFGPLV
jgi:DNA-directed RNA polymerase specialized sigma24 family protein